ncbi:MAG: HdeD family acid-resistance protein [Candidatus Eremiobacteraeota bacterium]|nr:HdeD family acid-resistance protein [Candidatus Eremiobacteraeota bacterium]MBV8355810.1 HdeD family acid-resistance protein [Candidatus Eremiobacteraeota bacterium]
MPSYWSLKTHWWALLARGIIAVLFGIYCFILTGAAIEGLVYVIGAFFVIDGVFMVAGAVRSAAHSDWAHWWLLLLGGLLGIAAGVLTFVWPGITAFTLAIFVGAWAFVTGVLELVTAMRMHHTLPNEWLWVLNGILSILLGVIIAVFPGAGLVALVWLIGFYAILAGLTMLALAFRLRSA